MDRDRRWYWRAKVGVLLAAIANISALAASEPPPVEGVYLTCEEVSIFFSEVLELRNGKFRYWMYSDAHMQGTKESEYPISGNYSVTGDILTLENKNVTTNIRTRDFINDTAILWRDDGLKHWKEKGEYYPYAVLIRVGDGPYDPEIHERSSIKRLYSKEKLKEEASAYEAKYPDVPACVALLLRARRTKGFSDLEAYKAELRRVRAEIGPEVVTALVKLLGAVPTSPHELYAEHILSDLYLPTRLIPEAPQFAVSQEQTLRVIGLLIDALPYAKDRRALGMALQIFLKAAKLQRIDLDLASIGAHVKLDTSDDTVFRDFTPLNADAIDAHMLRAIAAACQSWCREQIREK